ncbi:hypothetical protein BURK_019940 [Burkholderia sp. SJ98]|nr:hypothetical protein BURK_019940 [Burkholderia sp. SJ98]
MLIQRGLTLDQLSKRLGVSSSDLTSTGPDDMSARTLDALAEGADAEWILVPKEHARGVHRLMESRGLEPDYSAPTAAELYLRSISDKR